MENMNNDLHTAELFIEADNTEYIIIIIIIIDI